MNTLDRKKAVVVGGSLGVGREIVAALADQGAEVLAVARSITALHKLEQELAGIRTLAADATLQDTPQRVFAALKPDILVINAAAIPHMAMIHEQDWEQFSRAWDTDVKATFLFCSEALRAPLEPGSTVVIISGGPGVGGSLLSGGLSGAKRMQLFLAEFCQKHSDRLKLGIRFVALAPMRIMNSTRIGKVASEGYANYLGIPVEAFLASAQDPQTPDDVAAAVVAISGGAKHGEGSRFTVSGSGLAPVP